MNPELLPPSLQTSLVMKSYLWIAGIVSALLTIIFGLGREQMYNKNKEQITTELAPIVKDVNAMHTKLAYMDGVIEAMQESLARIENKLLK